MKQINKSVNAVYSSAGHAIFFFSPLKSDKVFVSSETGTNQK